LPSCLCSVTSIIAPACGVANHSAAAVTTVANKGRAKCLYKLDIRVEIRCGSLTESLPGYISTVFQYIIGATLGMQERNETEWERET
jgi:hypothetical protein